MPGQPRRTKGPRPASLNRPVAYQLKITLADIQPPIWRGVLVPGPLTLDRLHHVIQQLMGWTDAHLYAMAPKKGEFPMTERLREWYRKIGKMGGEKGGKKGGHRAALNMTPAERIERAKKGAAARWKKRKKG